MKWPITLGAFPKRRAASAGRPCRIHRPSSLVDTLESRTLLSAVTVQVAASQDTTLYSDQPADANGAGEFLLTGQAGEGDSDKHLLVKFDLESAGIPDGATIIDAVLTLNLAQTIGPSAAISVHQVTTAWGEAGSDAPGSEVNGVAAQQFDATWVYAFFDGAIWSSPGGDFDSAASATTEVDQPGTYQWFEFGIVDDVQEWLDDPASNHGWLLDGGGNGSLKSFTSKDSGNALLAPQLEITYEEPLDSGIVEGRIWHDINADGIRIPPDIADLGLIYFNGNNYYNSYGGSEYWFRSPETSEWYFLTADGRLTHWSRQPNVLSGDVVAELDPRVYYSADLLLSDPDAEVEPWINGFTVELLDSFGTVVATDVTRSIDINNDGQIYPEAEEGWYRFENVPDGDYTVRHIPPEGWKNSGSWNAPDAAQIFNLKESLGLHFWRSLYENFGGRGERWIRGSGAWYFITPNGDFYRWNGQAITESSPLAGEVVTHLGVEYYRDPSLIYDARSPVHVISSTDGDIYKRVDFGDHMVTTIKGRKWLDWDANGERATGIDPETGLIATISGPTDISESGSTWFYNEADDEWFIVTADGELQLWDGSGDPQGGGGGGSGPGPSGNPGGGDDSGGPVTAEPWLNGWTVELLDANGYVVQTTVTQDIDWDESGTIEPESERGWYLFEDLLPGDYTVRFAGEDGFVQTSAPPADTQTSADSLFSGGTFSVGANDYFNWGGLNERWVWGQGAWHYITADGNFYRWTPGTGGGTGVALGGTLVAQLSGSFYVNLDLFANPNSTRVKATSGTGVAEVSVGSHRLIDGAFADLSELLLS